MGSMGAQGFKDLIDDGSCKLEAALLWHLRANHYPPVPSAMVKPAKLAIQYANRGKWNSNITLPPGILWRGKKVSPVSAIIESLHLDTFLDDQEDCND